MIDFLFQWNILYLCINYSSLLIQETGEIMKRISERCNMQNNKYLFLQICCLVFIVWVLFFGMQLPQDVTIYNQEPFNTVDNGWVQIIDGEQIELEDIADFVACTTEEAIVLEQTIQEDMVGKCLVFYAEHQEVVIMIDGIEVYNLSCPEYLTCYGSPGRTWVNVFIPEDSEGQTLSITLTSNFQLYHGVPSVLYCIETSEIYSVQMDFLWLRNTAALIVLALAILSYINAILWKQKKMRRYLFAMADLYLFVALWLCAEVNILAIWLGRAFLSSIMAMIFIRIILIAYYHFLVSFLSYTSWRTRLLGFLVWGNFIGSMILQFVFCVSLIQLLWVNMVVVILLCILSVFEIVLYYRSRKQYHGYDCTLYLIVILIIAFLLECYIYMHYLLDGQWMGMPLTVACVLYALISHVFLVREESKNNAKKLQLEYEYNNLHKKPLNQQINAHFLYNSLNAISAYCKEDPELADEMVLLVAQYMRSYTNLIGESEYVTLEEELELIQYYMDIQNMRFENRIVFSIESDYEDVMLPPLTLQPLVENAVNHGLRNRRYRGEISIETHHIYDMVEIVVRDNGIGFDIAHLEKVQGVGLRNLEKRILAMGGCMVIKSELEKGTEVRISVPFHHIGEEGQL